MGRSRWIIVALLVLLVATNVWWASLFLDAGITATYTQVSLHDSQKALAQSLAVIEAATKPDATAKSVVEAAHVAGAAGEPFEKDGYIWVGVIGLRFDPDGRLVSIQKAWVDHDRGEQL